jgi:acetyltransferase-like isoleucine patch superfamily enzyme
MFHKIFGFFYAKSRAFAPWSSLFSPRPDVVGGFAKWRWLVEMRRSGRLLDPSLELRCTGDFRRRLDIGLRSAVDKGTILWMGDECGEQGKIAIGENVYIGPYCFLGSCHDLQIGENSLIGAHSYLITVNHRTDQVAEPVSNQGYQGDDIKIGKNVWLGAHVVVLPRVQIGDNAVIGAGAVVTKSVPSGETWGGVPAAPLRK